MTTSQKYLLRHTYMTHVDSYCIFEPYDPEPKTQVELRMIRASAAIRFAPDWVEKLHDDSQRKEWTVQVKKAFGLNKREVKYVFDELEYYAKLMANGHHGVEPGAVDMTWIDRGKGDGGLAEEVVRNAGLLEDNYANGGNEDMNGNKPSDRKVLVDPFLYAFASDESQVFKKPITSPIDAVNPELPRIKPNVYWKWQKAIGIHNDENEQNRETTFDKREISILAEEQGAIAGSMRATCWIPTDFDVGEDGSVSIRSYINNLHPVRYAELYQTISKVFSKCIPVLERVLTDVLHPRRSRDVFGKSMSFKCDIPHPHDIIRMVEKGEPLAEKYQKFVTTSDSYGYGRKWNDTLVVNGIELDTSALFDEWAKTLPSTVSSSQSVKYLPFSPKYGPTVPYSLRGLPLQASVEMAAITLTPDNPSRVEGDWRGVGREQEAISTVCLYFYDVENVANARLMFRDLVVKKVPCKIEKNPKLYKANDMADYNKQCNAVKAIGGEEIKAGCFICYPNLYETKFSSIQLADPTRNGHIKYIAFYIVDPSRRKVSTEIVPPRQPSWTQAGLALASVANNTHNLTVENDKARVAFKKAMEERDELERKHREYTFAIYCPCMWHKKLPNVKAPLRSVVSSIRHFLGY